MTDGKRVLAIGAHPDDVEFLCAGTLARLKEAGWEIHIATFAPGDAGSAELPAHEIGRIRWQEAINAAALLDGEYHCLEERDALMEDDNRTRAKATALIRNVAPNLVITNSPGDYMMDHEVTSNVVRNACFLASVPNYDHGAAGLAKATSNIPHLYYMDPIEGKDIFGRPITPGIYVDISAQMEIKEKMLACHASQRNWLLKQHGVDHYIHSMKEWSQKRGEDVGVEFAESFRQHLGHAYPQDNILAPFTCQAVSY